MKKLRTDRPVDGRRGRRLAVALAAGLLLVADPALANGTEQLVNERLAFGGIPTSPPAIEIGEPPSVTSIPVGPLGAANSVMASSGMLDSPYYRSTLDQNWYPMTYNGENPSSGGATIPLSFGLGVGRIAEADTFHQNRFVAVSQISNSRLPNDEASFISGTGVSTVDAAGNGVLASAAFTVTRTAGDPGRGVGTLTATGYLEFGTQILKITHAYTLEAGANFLRAVSTFENMSNTPMENVNFWVGTSDDWLGLNYDINEEESYSGDSPSQRKGLIQGNAFRAVCEGPTNAVITFNEREYTLLYSNSSGSQGLLTDSINSFQSSVNDPNFTNDEDDPYASIIDLDPSTTEDEILYADSAVGLYLPVGDLAAHESAGDEGSVTWFIEGGSLGFTVQDCNATTAVPTTRLECTPDPVAPGGTVTASITGADPEIDFLWRTSHGGSTVAEAAVRSAADGTGTFTFTAPVAARGSTVTAELVEWNTACTVSVAENVLPTRLPAGEGNDLPLGGLVALALLLGGGLLTRMTKVRAEG